jgi:transposase
MAHLRVDRHAGARRGAARIVSPPTRLTPRAIRAQLRHRGISAVIAEPADQTAHRKRRGSRGGRPPLFDAQDYRNRNAIERGFNAIKQWRGLATRYDKLAIVYLAAVVLHAAITWTTHLSGTP